VAFASEAMYALLLDRVLRSTVCCLTTERGTAAGCDMVSTRAPMDLQYNASEGKLGRST
jgi:hypothetical protein